MKQPKVVSIGLTDYAIDEQVMNDLRLRMYNYKPKELAEMLGVSVSCVYALKSGRTKWPRGKTLFALLEALDIKLRLYDAKAQRYL